MPGPDLKSNIEPVKPLPHVDAIRYWRQKKLITSDEYKELVEAAKSKTFYVSGITKMDALDTVFNAVGAALENGESFGDFKKRIRKQILEKDWGPRRVATIYRTNIQTAYNAGHWKRYARDGIEVLVYDAVGDSRTRPTHAALDGRAFRRDDPFWNEWFPPNGFGCRCTTQGMSAIEADARGIVVESGTDTASQWVELPNGQSQPLLPDPGFAHNPGKAMYGLEPYGPEKASKPLGTWPQKQTKTSFSSYSATQAPAQWRAGLPADDSTRASFRDLMRYCVDQQGIPAYYEQPASNRTGQFDIVAKLAKGRHGLELAPLIPRTIRSANEAYLQPMITNDGKVQLRQVFFKRFLVGGKPLNYMVAADYEDRRWKIVTAYEMDDVQVEKKRIGHRIK